MSAGNSVLKLSISLVWWAGRSLARRLRGDDEGRLTILYYHAVRSEDAAAFERQVRMAKASGHPVRADYVAPADQRRRVAITFDDAFTSVIDNALPILEAEDFPCTIFAPVGQLGEHPAWEMEASAADRAELIASAAALRDLPQLLVDIGAHSVTHPRLSRIPLDEAEQEIRRSRVELARSTGRAIDGFAFPYGDFNAAVLGLCAKAGYRFVYSIGPGSLATTDLTMLRPRVAANPTDWRLVFWLKLRGGYEWMPYASRLKQRVLRPRPR